MNSATKIESIESTGRQAVTRTQAARLLGVDPRTLSKAIDAGDVPVIKIGPSLRIPTSWLRKQLNV